MQRFPESEAMVRERAQHFTDFFDKLYSKDQSNRRALHLVVTHGTPLRMFSQLHGGKKKKVKFCGVTVAALTPDYQTGKASYQLLTNCRHKHLFNTEIAPEEKDQ